MKPSAGPQRWKRLLRPILNRIWYVHPPVVLVVQARAAVCLQMLVAAAKPSTQRLHLRNLFVGGRRYQLEPSENGFRMTTTSKVVWRYRRRTSPSAVLSATFSELTPSTTSIHLQVRIRLFYLLDAFLMPLYLTFVIAFLPWSPALILAILLTLLGLSWLGHRYNAALEAHEMIYFVQTALEDLVPAKIVALDSATPDVVYSSREFGEQSEKFYEEHKDE